MLVLSRKKLESVMVGGCSGFERMLKVTVIEIRGGSVRLGFDEVLGFHHDTSKCSQAVASRWS